MPRARRTETGELNTGYKEFDLAVLAVKTSAHKLADDGTFGIRLNRRDAAAEARERESFGNVSDWIWHPVGRNLEGLAKVVSDFVYDAHWEGSTNFYKMFIKRLDAIISSVETRITNLQERPVAVEPEVASKDNLFAVVVALKALEDRTPVMSGHYGTAQIKMVEAVHKAFEQFAVAATLEASRETAESDAVMHAWIDAKFFLSGAREFIYEALNGVELKA
ncbi:hypothetical protein M1589_03745 [Candidatus Marsarchaeota archaeon]|jgi:hypothetical protein|nr:hypothetical protein [Candidatus Marsarchaeota archaeon]MCL5115483.1 hypothetical protein [Candidatus Marsarchaeota archaeon]